MGFQQSAVAFLVNPPALSDLNALLMRYWFPLLLVITALFWLLSRLRTKHFYIVRHGKTILNEAEVRQDETGSLNEAGRVQADIVGLYLAQFPIQEICSSTYERAKETAETINARIGNVPVTYSPLLGERRNPSNIVGKSFHDTEVERVIGLMDQSFHEDDFRVSDEENFMDMKNRARMCVAFLECRGPHEVCVVTHKIFLQLLLSYITVGEALHAADYAKLSFFNPADNAGVSVCSYTPWKKYTKSRGWEIISYNESMSAPHLA